MKKSISAILCLSVIAVLAGCNADPAETSVSVPTASFDPSNFETTEATQTTYPYSSDFSLPTNGDPFTNEELLDLAKKGGGVVYNDDVFLITPNQLFPST